jgi:stage II sporulation protein P
MNGYSRNRVRRKKRNRDSGNSGRLVLIALACILLAAGFYRAMPAAAVPVLGQPRGTGQSGDGPLLHATMLMRIIAQVIPGLSESVVLPVGGEAGGSGDHALSRVGLADPRDPKNILAGQIPYMVEAVAAGPPTSEGAAGETGEEARIVIPLRRLSGQGTVIIYHVHTTESFVPTSGVKFTENLELTVAHLGATLAHLLTAQYGIPVVHDRTIHDIPRNTAYEVALPTVERLLAAKGDAQLVVDLHRDGVARSVTTVSLAGGATGRVLFVVGTRHPRWQENQQKAQFMHEKLEELAPGLSRGIRERPLVYNQHVHPGALLIEVGGHENSLEEVLRTLPYLADALAQLYNSGL